MSLARRRPAKHIIESAHGSEFHADHSIAGTLTHWEQGKLYSEELPLTPRQTQVLQLAAHGLLIKQIAAELNITYNSVLTHRKFAFLKLEAHNITHAVALAIRAGYIK